MPTFRSTPGWLRILLLLTLAAGCRALPGAFVGAGTGAAIATADVTLSGESGALTGLDDSSEADLDPRWGGEVRAGFEPSADFLVGVKLGVRRCGIESTSLLGAELTFDDVTTLHPGLFTHWYPWGRSGSVQPFLSLGLEWIPDVDTQAEVAFPGSGSATLPIHGDSYVSLGLGAGLTFALGDNWSLDLGGTREMALGSSEAEFELDVPTSFGLVPSTGSVEIEPEGWVFSLGLTFAL